MKSLQIISLCAGLEQELDTRLFRERDKEDNTVGAHKTVKGAVLTGAGVVGATGAAGAVRKYANSAGVNDRLGGLRSTRPGFTKLSPTVQRVAATASRAGTDAAAGVKSAAGMIGKEAAYAGRGVYNAAENAGIGALRKTKPLGRNLLTRVGALAARIK